MAVTWSIEHEVREDAESVFVPAELLDRAQPGDTVELLADGLPGRHGAVVELVHDEVRGDFVVVALDPPR